MKGGWLLDVNIVENEKVLKSTTLFVRGDGKVFDLYPNEPIISGDHPAKSKSTDDPSVAGFRGQTSQLDLS